MELGFIGLGRMGGNMVQRLLRGGEHQAVVYDRELSVAKSMEQFGARAAASLEDLMRQLKAPRTVWMMVPAGDPVDETLQALMALGAKRDIFIDGGNSYYKDSIRRAKEVEQQGFHFLDAGTSGGIWGLQVGYCMMIGGRPEVFRHVEPVLKTLAPEDGYGHMGPSGSGHFVKMVHNGIEYGMMQAYAEGFEILHASQYDLDNAKIAKLWNQGSVVRSWLLELAESAFQNDPQLSGIQGYVEDTGEGRWTVLAAIEEDVPATSIAHALFARFSSRQQNSFGNRLLAALRNEFGGHAVRTAESDSPSRASGR